MITRWILPFFLILTGLFSGIICEKVLIQKLKKIVASRRVPVSEIFLHSINRMPLIWCILAGLYGATISYGPEPEVAELLKKCITIAFLYSVTLVFARLTAGLVNIFLRRTEGLSASLISNGAKTAVLILGILILLQTLGIEVTPVITTLGITGIAVGLALQDTLANLFSGFYLIISKQVRTGDYVKLDGGHEGYITDVTWRNTTIKELSNNVIIVPNSKLATTIFTNYHLPVKEITLTMTVGVSYDSDLDQVERVSVEMAKEVMQEIAPELIDNEPYIRFNDFADFSINFTLYMRVNEFFDQRIAKHLFIKKLHKRYQQEGIKIPFPATDIYVQRNGSTEKPGFSKKPGF